MIADVGGSSFSPSRPPIVCISHLGWDPGLFQRPQQIMARLAGRGHQVLYFACVGRKLHKQQPQCGPVLQSPGVSVYTVPYAPGVTKLAGLRKWAAALQIARVLRKCKVHRPILWFYHPSLFSLGYSHADAAIVYDVMDHFPSFEATVDDVYFDELMILAEADVIFTGGRTLQRHVQQMLDALKGDLTSPSAARRDSSNMQTSKPYCFPSGVDLHHFAPNDSAETPAGTDQPFGRNPVPVFGYFGAIDERMDWEIIRHLSGQTTGTVLLAGPVLRSIPPDLPANVILPGPVAYADLPGLLATFTVALLPFCDSPLVHHISPTKTPEYLAGGKPVVSTPIPDVVAEYGDVVTIADTPASFTAACLEAAAAPPLPAHLMREASRRAKTWDRIAAEMDEIVTGAAEKNRNAEGR